MTKHIAILLLALLTAGLVSAQDKDRPTVVATTTQAADAVRVIGGEDVELIALMGAGVDPHLYSPTEADISAMNNADMLVYMGLNLEGQFGEVIEALGETDVRVVSLGRPVQRAGFTIGGFDLSEEFENVDDPHFWFDPRNWQISINTLAEELAMLLPEQAETFTERAAAYNAQLDTLYEWGVNAIEQLPEELRVLVTSHDAFQYFGDAFGLQVEAVQGLSTEDEAGVGDVQEVVNYVVENDIPVLFVESSIPRNTIESVVEAAQSQGQEVTIGVRELYSDAMGAPEDFSGAYTGMLSENIITILQSYGVEIPDYPETLEPQPPADLLNLDDTSSNDGE